MADDPSKTPGTPAETPSPQIIPLAKIHDLPGVFIQKQPDKSYGGLVSSIQVRHSPSAGGWRVPACDQVSPAARERTGPKAGHPGLCVRYDAAAGGGLPPAGAEQPRYANPWKTDCRPC